MDYVAKYIQLRKMAARKANAKLRNYEMQEADRYFYLAEYIENERILRAHRDALARERNKYRKLEHSFRCRIQSLKRGDETEQRDGETMEICAEELAAAIEAQPW